MEASVIILARDVVRDQFVTLVSSNLPLEDELAFWTMLHQAAEASWETWESAQRTEESLAAFVEKLQLAYRKLTADLKPCPHDVK